MSDYIHPLTSALEQYANQPALISERGFLTYHDLWVRVAQISAALRSQHVEQGDTIVLDDLAPEEMIPALWSASICGTVAFPLNTRFPFAALEKLLGEIEPKIVIANREFPGNESMSVNQLRSSDAPDMTGEHWDPHAPTTMLMTSGSSGQPKIVVHSAANHISSAAGSNMNIPLEKQDRWMLTLPLYHVGGLSILYRCARAGAAVVVPDPSTSLGADLRMYSPTHISLVATQLQRIMDEPDGISALQGLRAILLGGSSIPRSLIDRALSNDLPIYLSYGSTEMASQVCTTNEQDRETGLLHSGRILSGRDLIISYEGEILVKGPTLALGYYNDSEIVDLRDHNGWFHTGDLGYLEVGGALTVTGRMDNQFISGGENIQPEHIERALLTLPDIEEAIVIPQGDEDFGARPVAFLTTSATDLSRETLNESLRRSLPGYMIPVAYYHLPMTTQPSGIKLSRKDLLDHLIDENNPLQSI